MKRLYITPKIYYEVVESSNTLTTSIELGTGSGGDVAEAKRYSIFMSYDSEGSDDSWENFWTNDVME